MSLCRPFPLPRPYLSLQLLAVGSGDASHSRHLLMRTPSGFCNFISRDPNSPFPAECGRYHLYLSFACSWACWCLAYLKIKGLDKITGHMVVKSKWGRTKDGDTIIGWVFPASSAGEPEAEPDPINGAGGVRDFMT
ncbi:hypothetical protein EUGRSUZ_E01814 [Eucalyptus grandis]|uniref:Uncharacterized protein n=2 Tax=Eucalyptus grandis TaxID=71139 RepID=A0ACC3KVT8_EUCGR|nr:hypothetical protein EUGRSUZ_E01814 [Eucalyptus grandis]